MLGHSCSHVSAPLSRQRGRWWGGCGGVVTRSFLGHRSSTSPIFGKLGGGSSGSQPAGQQIPEPSPEPLLPAPTPSSWSRPPGGGGVLPHLQLSYPPRWR